jgi:hypothetical protein
MYERNLIDYLPDFLKDVREYKAILTDAVQPEVVKLFEAIENAMNDQFIMDATETGVSRWEKMLKIAPKPDYSLDDRRFSIFTRMNEQIPYTLKSLKQMLENLCGEDGYDVKVENFSVKVRIALGVQNRFKEVCTMLESVVPANMVIDVSLMYNQIHTISEYTHEQLSTSTHNQLRNEVVNNG